MPVAQLVHLFEAMDQSTYEPTQHKTKRILMRSPFSHRRKLSLKTMFGGHSRGASTSSTMTAVSSAASPSSPNMSSSSFNISTVSSSTSTSPQSEHSADPFRNLALSAQMLQQKAMKSTRPARMRRNVSSTSIALQAEFQVDQTESCGVDLFEPRPMDIFGGIPSTFEPIIMDGILEVMENA